MRYFTVLFLTAALAGIASADILGFQIDSAPVPGTVGLMDTIAADTLVTNDLTLTVDSDWLSAILVVTPSGGGIYQHPVGAANPQSPNPLLFPAYACLPYDTYISNGVLGETCSTAAAVDLGHTSIIFDGTQLAVAYYTTDLDDLGALTLARVTLENTAGGTWDFIATASPAEGPKIITGGPIVEGYMLPEPATLGLLAIGGLGVLIRRKR